MIKELVKECEKVMLKINISKKALNERGKRR